MKILNKSPDGGKESGVTAYMLIEWKGLFSIGLLHFNAGSREAFHSHAFNALTWWLKGSVTEVHHPSGEEKEFSPSFKVKLTKRDCFHKIIAKESTWAFTIRGPWKDHWQEFKRNRIINLTHGRKVL